MTKARPLGLLVLLAALFTLSAGASSAQAAFGIAEWEAVTCKENVDVPAAIGPPGLVGAFPLDDDPAGEQCNTETPSKWFTQATGHPNFGITDFTLNTLQADKFKGFPDGFVKDIVVDTPEGLGVNPEATPVKCTPEELEAEPAPTCNPASIVGFNYLTVAAQGPPCEAPVPNVCLNARVKVPVYNLVPFPGVPSMVGFPTSDPGDPTFIVGDLDPSDQHVRFTISDIHAPDGTLEHPPIVASRLVFSGKAGNGTYLTMPSNCAGGQTSTIFVDSYPNPFPGGAEESDEASFTTSVGADECDTAPFDPDLATASGDTTDSPEPATVDVQMPKQLEPGLTSRGQSHLLKATVTLPDGTALNPSTANGLAACTDAQFKKGTDDPIECPAASRIGSVDVTTPALDQHLGGDVYVGQPLNNNPSSGDQFRIFIHAFNDRYGVNVRLIGNVFPNPDTGQLRVVVPNNPQAPFSSFKVNVDGGPRGALSSPFTCGPHTTAAVYNSWSRPAEDVTRTSDVSLTKQPGGGDCPKTLAERPFGPGFAGGTRDPQAGAYSPLDIHVTRPDGAQELKRLDVTLPPGMTASLRGLAYCPEDRIAAAAGSSGADQLAHPSCPDSSLIGSVRTTAGTGSNPFAADGKAYLAGPYKGAPLSLVTVTPAVAGPYDLGTVVIRAALNVDPETAVVHAVSDAIPDVFGGVRLDIRAIDISLDRAGYTVNPTTCREQTAVTAQLYGGGGDPHNAGAWVPVTRSQPFRATNCRALKFKPTFYARVLGGRKATRRRAHPRFQAILKARRGDANLRRASFILPRATILDQGHIDTLCTRVQLAANSCPKGSIYGHAKATSPLINGNLKGPVYMTSSEHTLPDLLVDLRGQVNVRLRGVISAVKGHLKTVFPESPDVAVTKFTMTMKGGHKGLLQNTVNLCGRKRFSFLNLRAQNSRRVRTKRQRLFVQGCKHKKKKRHQR
jgi:hypothetical protein